MAQQGVIERFFIWLLGDNWKTSLGGLSVVGLILPQIIEIIEKTGFTWQSALAIAGLVAYLIKSRISADAGKAGK